MADRRAKAIVLVAGLVAAVFAMDRTPPAGAQAQPPELRRRPADVVLDDGYDHVIVHADGTPSGAGVVEAEALGGGDWSLVLERGTDPTSVAGVEAVTEDVWLDPYGASDDPHLGQTWGIDNDGRAINGWPGVADADIDATTAWDRAQGGGIVVAVVDSGVDRTHPDLRDRMWENADETCGDGDDDDGNGYVDDCHGWDFVRGDNTPYDVGVDSNHGTHVAGTIAATANDGIGVAGVAPAASIMGLKVSESASFRLSDALAAVNYAVANGADVINASWGTTGVPLSAVLPLEAAVERARQAGVFVVAAAGNDARDIDASPSFPASFPQENVLTVAASTNAEAHAYFSNRGTQSVDLHAPGWFIWSTLPGGSYGFMSGTSMAAPHVAGAVALAMSANPSASVEDIRAAVLGSVDRVAAFDGRTATGGRLNAASLVGVSDLPVALRFSGEPGEWLVDAVANPVPEADVRLVAGLASRRNGGAWAVVDHPVSLGGMEVRTDAAGWISSPPFPGDALHGMRVAYEAELPPGEYSLVVGVLDAATGEPIGSPQATFGTVSAPVDEPVAPPIDVAPPAPAPAAPPTTVPPAPGDGYEPAPLPPTGQPVPPPATEPAPCSSCGSAPVDDEPAPTVRPPSTWPTEDDPRPPVGDDAPPWSPPPRIDEPAWTPPLDEGPAGDVPADRPPVWWPPADDVDDVPPAPPWAPTVPVESPTAPNRPPSPPAPATPPTTVATPPTTVAPRAPSGTFGLYAVEPAVGRTTGGTTVAVRGTAIPAGSTVRIGGTPADVRVDQAPELLLVGTRAHGAGVADVVVTARDGRTQTLVRGFTYVDESQPSPSTPPTTTAPAPAPVPEDEVEEPAPPVAEEPGSVEVEGLRLVRLGSEHPLSGFPTSSWPMLRCTDPRGCAGTVLRWPAPPTVAPPALLAPDAESAGQEPAKEKKGKKDTHPGGRPEVPPGQAKKG